jgi:hypothetical protein
MYLKKTLKIMQTYSLGNNIQAVKSYRMTIPLSINGLPPEAGQRFYFPETPAIESKNIVGLEGHIQTTTGFFLVGDLDINFGILNARQNLTQGLAQYFFFTIFSDDGSEKYFNVPFSSICLFDTVGTTTTKKRVYPFVGKIKTRKSYLTLPPGIPGTLQGNLVATLTFFYNQ